MKARWRERRRKCTFTSRPRVAVPDANDAVRAAGDECAEGGVPDDVVHGVAEQAFGVFFAVASEGVVFTRERERAQSFL